MLEVNIHKLSDDRNHKYVVIGAYYNDQLLMVRHQSRDTWEIPGGHIEKNETTYEAARRELHEETGALNFKIEAVADYSVSRDGRATYGRLYLAEINELGPLPDLEIVEVKSLSDDMVWTYDAIQPILLKRIEKYKIR